MRIFKFLRERASKIVMVLATLVALCLFLPPVLLAAGELTALAIQFDWKPILALVINSVLVVLAVQLLKPKLPGLPDWPKQLLALVAGPLLLWAQNALTTWLGWTVDLGPLIELFAGLGTAMMGMGLFDLGKRAGVLKGSP